MSISVHHEILEQSVDGVHSYTQFVNLNVDNNTMLRCTVYYICNPFPFCALSYDGGTCKT